VRKPQDEQDARKQAVLNWIESFDGITAAELKRKSNYNRGTIDRYLLLLQIDGKLVKKTMGGMNIYYSKRRYHDKR
jgi:predicted transcriptional regulator